MVAPPEFWQGIAEFNQQQFYACHDTLEAIWIEAPESDKKFYQGILQVAVGCYHLSNGNWRGAVILLGEGVRRLCEYLPSHYDVNVQLLLEQSNQLLQTLQHIKPEQAEAFFQQLQNPDDGDRDLIQGCQIPYIVTVN
ncbi:MAG: hypothetical protein Tsb0014_21370 [Pleurocapsa sp.]